MFPRNHATRLIQMTHGERGHPGIGKTIELISASYYWPKMSGEVSKCVKSCYIYQISTLGHEKPLGKYLCPEVKAIRLIAVSKNSTPWRTRGGGVLSKLSPVWRNRVCTTNERESICTMSHIKKISNNLITDDKDYWKNLSVNDGTIKANKFIFFHSPLHFLVFLH